MADVFAQKNVTPGCDSLITQCTYISLVFFVYLHTYIYIYIYELYMYVFVSLSNTSVTPDVGRRKLDKAIHEGATHFFPKKPTG